MATRILLLPVAFALGTAASAALAGPVTLTEVQMDMVTAGAEVTNEPGRFRYEGDNGVVVEMKGHEGRVKYKVVETEDGSALLVVVPSDGTRKVVPLSSDSTTTGVSLSSDSGTVTISAE